LFVCSFVGVLLLLFDALKLLAKLQTQNRPVAPSIHRDIFSYQDEQIFKITAVVYWAIEID